VRPRARGSPTRSDFERARVFVRRIKPRSSRARLTVQGAPGSHTCRGGGRVLATVRAYLGQQRDQLLLVVGVLDHLGCHDDPGRPVHHSLGVLRGIDPLHLRSAATVQNRRRGQRGRRARRTTEARRHTPVIIL